MEVHLFVFPPIFVLYLVLVLFCIVLFSFFKLKNLWNVTEIYIFNGTTHFLNLLFFFKLWCHIFGDFIENCESVQYSFTIYVINLLISGRKYYMNIYTKTSQWEIPTEKAPQQVRCSHLLVKHNESRRPSSWKQDTITRTKDEALQILQGRILNQSVMLKILINV